MKNRPISGTIEYGFKTTSLTKPAIISALRSRIAIDPSIIPDTEFWYEAEYYIMDDPARNIMSASQGHHDDIIMAIAIGMYVSDSFQSKQGKVIVKNKEVNENFLVNMVNKQSRKKPRIRKGVYTNHA